MKIIIDTDLGCDCDDAGALAVAHSLADNGACEIDLITHCTSNISGCNAICAINLFYGRSDIPVGTYQKDDILKNKDGFFSDKIAEKFGMRYKTKADCPDAVKQIRTVFAKADTPITLIALGPLAVISDFLESGADEISDLSGLSLAKNNGGDLVVMAGSFMKGFENRLENGAEWNVKQAVSAAGNVFSKYPNLIFAVPFEAGIDVLTGKFLVSCGDENPVALAYRLFLKDKFLRSSWDQCAVHFAVTRNEEIWNVSNEGHITIDDNGVSIFDESEKRGHFIVMPKDISDVTCEIERLMTREDKD